MRELALVAVAAALALGAVISPPDAVAATSIGKRLGLPPRLVTILEGEGLVNDATALVLMRTAIAAIATTVSFGSALGDFAFAVAVGIAIGVVVGIVSVWVRSKIQSQPVLTTAISFVVPFLAFIPAEELHASGVVTAGLITGHQSARRFAAHDRVSERTNWRTIQLLLENGVFLLMGFELTSVVADVADEGLGRTLVLGLLVTAALVVLRVVFVVPLIALLRRARLVVQGGSLPPVIRWLGVRGNDEVLRKARKRSLVVGEVIEKMFAERDPDSHLHQQRELQRLTMEAQQNALLDARAGGTYGSHTLERAQIFVDSASTRFAG